MAFSAILAHKLRSFLTLLGIKTAGEMMVIDERRVEGYAAERLDQRLDEFQALVTQSHPTNNPAELHQL